MRRCPAVSARSAGGTGLLDDNGRHGRCRRMARFHMSLTYSRLLSQDAAIPQYVDRSLSKEARIQQWETRRTETVSDLLSLSRDAPQSSTSRRNSHAAGANSERHRSTDSESGSSTRSLDGGEVQMENLQPDRDWPLSNRTSPIACRSHVWTFGVSHFP